VEAVAVELVVPARATTTAEADDMGKAILFAAVSLDGYIAREDDSVGPLFDWYGNGDVAMTFTDEARVFHVTAETVDFLRSMTPQMVAGVVGCHLFDVTDGWEGAPPNGEHAFVVTHDSRGGGSSTCSTTSGADAGGGPQTRWPATAAGIRATSASCSRRYAGVRRGLTRRKRPWGRTVSSSVNREPPSGCGSTVRRPRTVMWRVPPSKRSEVGPASTTSVGVTKVSPASGVVRRRAARPVRGPAGPPAS
jgi:hypothetical protein